TPVVMRDGDVLLGEGVTHNIPVQGSRVSSIPLPMANPGATPADRPILGNVVGAPAVTFANENRFGGFFVQNTQGTALLFQDINGGPSGDPTRIQDVTINGTTGVGSHGIEFSQTGGSLTGNFLFDGIEINNTSGDAIHIDGGAASITMLIQDAAIPANTITNNAGYSLNIQNNSGVVTLGQLAIEDDGGDGILIQNSSAEITIGANSQGDTALLTNTPGTPVEILDLDGSVTFLGPITIEDPGDIGIDIQGLGPEGPNFAGRVDFLGPVSITGRGDIGINVVDIEGEVAFSDDVSVTAPAAGAVGAAINFQDSSGNLVFNAGTATNPAVVILNGGNAEGINIAGSFANTNTGEFRAEAQVNISNMAGTGVSIIENSGPVEFNGVSVSFRGGRGVDLQRNVEDVRFNSLTSITNELLSGNSGVNIQENTGNSIFGVASVIGALGPEAAINVEDNIGIVDFNEAGGTSFGTTFFFGDDNVAINVGGGEIEATQGRGVTLTDNALDPVAGRMLVIFEEVSASQSDYGIFLENNGVDNDNGVNSAEFSVIGDSATAGSGGTIQLMSDAGTHALDTGEVSLAYQIYSQNTVGIEAFDSLDNDLHDVDSLTVDNTQVTLSAQNGVRTFNIDEVTITDSDFSSNGFATVADTNFEHVFIEMTRVRYDDPITRDEEIPYEVELARNTFIDTGLLEDADMVLIQGQFSGGAGLDLLVEDNGIPGASIYGFNMNRETEDRLNVAALNVAWNGPLTATIQNNAFIWSSTEPNLIAIDISNLSTSETSDVFIDANEIVSGTGFNNTAIRATFFSETDLTISNHFLLDEDGNRFASITMRGDQNVGLDLSLQGGDFKSIVINDNNLDFTDDDGTAILFDRLDGPALVSVNNNVMQMTNNFILSLPGERGIVFNTVTNIGGVSLSGTGNTFTVFPVSDVFSTPFSPVGLFSDANGGIEINGTVFR
ncbi:MAG: beta strand repeat-containing protein, partial [Maioricimonas sp. JB045]